MPDMSWLRRLCFWKRPPKVVDDGGMNATCATLSNCRTEPSSTVRRGSLGALFLEGLAVQIQDRWAIETWSRFVLFASLYCCVTLPYRCAFGNSIIWLRLDYATDFVCLIDFIQRFYIAQPNKETVILDRRIVLELYLRRDFWINGISAIPVCFVVAENVLYPQWSTMFLAVRLVRLVRIWYLLEFFEALEKDLKTPYIVTKFARFIFIICLQAHWIACCWFAIAYWYEANGGEERTWVTRYDVDLYQKDSFTRYIRSVYWSVVTMCTVGFGDITPQNNIEVGFSVCVILGNLALSSYLLGNMAALATSADAHVSEYRFRMASLRELMTKHNYPMLLQKKLVAFFVLQHNTHSIGTEMLESLPYSMRAEVAEVVNRNLLEVCELFHGCESRFITALAVIMRPQLFTSDQTITRVADASREMYIVAKGEVILSSDTADVASRILKSGDFFGEVAFLFGIRQVNTAITKSHCTLLTCSKTEFEELTTNFLDQVELVRKNALRLCRGTLGKHFEEVKASLKRLEEEMLMRLCYHASFNDLENCERLLNGGLDVNAADYDGRTGIHLGASEGNVKVVEFLLKRGADINCKDRWGGTPMQNAVKFGHDDVCAVLRAHGARLIRDDIGDMYHAAAMQGDLETVQRLIKNGCNINMPYFDGRTALHLACAEGRISVVEYLLNAGANYEAKDDFGSKPIDDAIRESNDMCVDMIRNKAAGLEVRSSSRLSRRASSKQSDNDDALCNTTIEDIMTLNDILEVDESEDGGEDLLRDHTSARTSPLLTSNRSTVKSSPIPTKDPPSPFSILLPPERRDPESKKMAELRHGEHTDSNGGATVVGLAAAKSTGIPLATALSIAMPNDIDRSGPVGKVLIICPPDVAEKILAGMHNIPIHRSNIGSGMELVVCSPRPQSSSEPSSLTSPGNHNRLHRSYSHGGRGAVLRQPSFRSAPYSGAGL